MLENIKKSIGVTKQILSKKKYLFIFLLVSIISFFIMYKLTVLNIADQDLGIYVAMSGTMFTFLSLVSAGLISLLFGIFSSLFVYKMAIISQFSSKMGLLGTFGVGAGLFSAGCPTCGATLFAFFGAPLALMFFPLKGLELKILSIGILLISNHFFAKNLFTCKSKIQGFK